MSEAGFAGLVLTVEGNADLEAPSWEQCAKAVDSLSPNRGSAFLILMREGKDYVQVTGGDGRFSVEWREHPKGRFRHWMAGIAGAPADLDVSITTTCARITVRENEAMSAKHVKALLLAFAEGNPRPADYSWRDITKQFT
jgi:hypothetical protein